MSVVRERAGSTVVIVGATAGIGRAVAHELAGHGADLVLAGRDLPELEALAADVAIRHEVGVAVEEFEALDYGRHADLMERCDAAARGIGEPDAVRPGVDGVVVCFGYLGNHEVAQRDWEEARRIVDINYTATVSLLGHVAEAFESRAGLGGREGREGAAETRQGVQNRTRTKDQPGPFICVVSSVAGDRGRRSNYLYGSAKGAVDRFLQGLRARMFASGVQVLTVKPGFVDTGMTYGMEGMFLVADPERVARDLYRGLRRGRSVVYTPWFWWWIMRILQHIPEPIFKRLPI